MNLFLIPNLSSTAVSVADPFKVKSKRPKLASKQQWSAWTVNPRTEGIFFSGYEGTTPSVRVSGNNPPWRMHAFIADFDMEVDQREIDTINQRAGVSPNWCCVTQSGHLRVGWEFESPILVHAAVHGRFLKALARELKLNRIHPQLDDRSFDPKMYWELGTRTVTLATERLKSDFLQSLLFHASGRADFREEGPSIPIEVIREAINDKFPGRWQGEVEFGARGVRFWDPTADNHTACILREAGAQCFTGTQAFVPWGQIFGQEFVRQFQANVITNATREVWFDGQAYWKREDNMLWVSRSRQDILLHLKGAGLSTDPAEGNLSDVERALLFVQDKQQVKAAVPLVHAPSGVVLIRGTRHLNTSTTEPVRPVETPQKWGENFPWMADFLENFFEPKGQLDLWMTHLRRFYAGALNKKLESGQVVITAGVPESGKTFLSTYVVSHMMGGHAEAADVLMGETSFNGHCFEKAVWTIDDSTPTADGKSHSRYTAMLKKMPVNHMFPFNNKYQKSAMLPWKGRIFITCNLDSESLRAMPDTDASILDRVHLFMVADRDRNFGNAEKRVDQELPYFCRWLIDWDPPAEVKMGKEVIQNVAVNRFGQFAYHHPALIHAARDSTHSNSFLELLLAFLTDWFNANKSAKEWRGTCTELIQQMMIDDAMKALITQYDPRTVGRRLSQLENQGIDIRYVRGSYGMRYWSMPRSLILDPKDVEKLSRDIK